MDGISSNLNNLVSAWVPQLPSTPQVQAWQLQQANYRNWWNWYTGAALKETVPNAKTTDGTPAYAFPLGINPVMWIVERHTSTHLGQIPEQTDIPFKLSYLDRAKKSTEACETARDIVETIWSESNAMETVMQGVTLSQFLGGFFYRVRWMPDNPNLTHGIKIECTLPDFVLPIYDTTDPWNLLECRLMYYISPEEVKNLGVTLPNGSPHKVIYSEHWTRDSYKVEVGGVVPKVRVGTEDVLYEGKNPWGVVPFVYVPHPSRVGGFYGNGHVDAVSEQIKELNRRFADWGDFVQESSYRLLAMKNAPGKIGTRSLTSRYSAIDLGSTGMSGKEPDLWDVGGKGGGGGKSDSTHDGFVDAILAMIDRNACLSSAAYGEHTASQRSAMASQSFLWPLMSHILKEREVHALGIKHVSRIIAKMIPELQGLRPQIGWYPMFPPDRDQLVNEAVQRRGSELISIEDGVRMLSDGGDVREQVERIKQDAKEEADLEAKIAAAKAPQGAI